MAGISIISFQSPLMQDLWHRIDAALPAATLAAYGATLIAVSSLFNGLGRLFWGGLSDRIGRVRTFRIMLGSQVAVFALLMFVRDPWLFGGLICYVLLCYGGGFGTMPSFVLDVFGGKMMPIVYGAILTAWSAAGIAGPPARRRAEGSVWAGRRRAMPSAPAPRVLVLGLGARLHDRRPPAPSRVALKPPGRRTSSRALLCSNGQRQHGAHDQQDAGGDERRGVAAPALGGSASAVRGAAPGHRRPRP